jgi:hypothetical protein
MDHATDAKAAEALAHLQAAALELIAAARSVLDVMEDTVHDPARVAQLVSFLAGTARPPTGAEPGARPRSDGDGSVEHIRVS